MLVVKLFLAVLGVAFVVLGIVLATFLTLWIRAWSSGVRVGLFNMLVMRLRRVNPALIVDCMISLSKADVDATVDDLETHVLAGGDLAAVTDALISAYKADLDVDFHRVAAIDLAGRDVVEAVTARVNPKVLVCPPAGSGMQAIAGVAQDGIRLGVRARVTVRTQLNRLVGGAGENTIIARVGEGIVAAIGRAESHRKILESPELIAEYLLEKGLDSGTCFEILSVDVSDVDVLDNVGARLKGSRADADKRIAQARAEVRRAAAVASRQEMKARTTEMQGRVVAAKSNVPLALSSAVHEANMGSPRPVPRTIGNRIRWMPVHK